MTPPEYEVYDFETAANALAEVRRQRLAGEPLVWTGPDKLHFSIAAGSPEPSWQFSPEGLEYHQERDRDFWDIYTMVAFQIGSHNGTVRESNSRAEHERTLKSMIDALRARKEA